MLFLDCERHGKLCVLPHEFQQPASRWIPPDRQGELVHGFIQSVLGQIHFCQIMGCVHGNSPAAEMSAKDELGGPVFDRHHIKSISAGGNGRAAHDNRLLRDQQRCFVRAQTPGLAVGNQGTPDFANFGRAGLV